MNPHKEPRERVAIIGAGRVGTAMASLLSSGGYPVVAVVDVSKEARERGARLSGARATADPAEAAAGADIVIITTPDRIIEETCRSIAGSSGDLGGKTFIHMSGALRVGVLEPARLKGARVASIHPIQTFADLEGALRELPGSTFGVTCEQEIVEWARGFVAGLGGTMRLINDEDKVLYHAAAVLACNLTTMVKHGALALARELGFSDEEFAKTFMPLAKATTQNVARLGPAGALTGPLARGDLDTVEKHLEALDDFDPELAAMYRAVCTWGLKVVAERGDVDSETIARMRDLLS